MKENKYHENLGHFSRNTLILMLGLLVLIALGGYGYYQQFTQGEVVTGLRNIGTMGGATWGLYVVALIYFVGVSFAGITIAALIRLFGLEQLKPVARMAEVLTVISLILGSLCVLVDVGQPGRALVNLFRYARPQSPFFGTFALVVSGYLFASLVYLFLEGRRDAAILAKKEGRLQFFYRLWASGYSDTFAERERRKKSSFWLAIAILPLLVTAHSTLGFVFGLQYGRPGWASALQAPGFTLLAGVSGLGMLIIIAAILRKALQADNFLDIGVFKWLTTFLTLLTGVYLYFTVVDWLSSTYSASQSETGISTALTTGDFSALYWISIALMVSAVGIGLMQYFTSRFNIAAAVFMGVAVNLAAVGKRFLIVVPSQTHGTLLPYGIGSYDPTWVEYSVVIGLLAMGILMYILFVKIFPIFQISSDSEVGM